MPLTSHIAAIQQLQPAIQSFVYKHAAWAKHVGAEYLVCLRPHAELPISRQHIFNAFAQYNATGQNFTMPFMLTMVWGFANSGYGPYRTNKYLNTPGTLERVEASIQLLQANNVQEAFTRLIGIEGLGISYASKLLYFAGRAVGIEEYPLIFDIRAAQSLIKLFAQNTGLETWIEIYPKNNWNTYWAYCQLIHKWAKTNNLAADQIELFLYKQEF